MSDVWIKMEPSGGRAMKAVSRWIAGHRKLLVAVAGAAVTVAVQAWGTSSPYVSLAVLAATSLGVYSAPNRRT